MYVHLWPEDLSKSSPVCLPLHAFPCRLRARCGKPRSPAASEILLFAMMMVTHTIPIHVDGFEARQSGRSEGESIRFCTCMVR